MGLHGSPTCVMRFESATGWIIGEPGRGLNAMFVMMNAARLHVALQGVGLLDAAWQKANAYAHDRRQMRIPGPRDASQPADVIIGHPAMQRILDTQRAWVDGARVLAYQTGIELDMARHHPDAARREQAQRWCSLLTPVLKAACTDQAFHGASDCLQVFGGHGYVREWGIEQIVRDSRVAMIYEGTNEIQAIDLLVRKVLTDEGQALAALWSDLSAGLEHTGVPSAAWLGMTRRLEEATRQLVEGARRQPELPYWVAGDFLRATALAMLSWSWLRIDAAMAAATDPARWQRASEAMRHWVVPEFDMRLAIIQARLAA